MAWSKPIAVDEEQFIREACGQLSAVDMAARLGRSRSAIYATMKRLGLRPPRARAEEDAHDVQELVNEPRRAPADNQLDALLELRDILRLALLDAGPQSIPKVAREYRETLDEIERLRDGGDSGADRGEDAFDALLGAIGRKLSS